MSDHPFFTRRWHPTRSAGASVLAGLVLLGALGGVSSFGRVVAQDVALQTRSAHVQQLVEQVRAQRAEQDRLVATADAYATQVRTARQSAARAELRAAAGKVDVTTLTAQVVALDAAGDAQQILPLAIQVQQGTASVTDAVTAYDSAAAAQTALSNGVGASSTAGAGTLEQWSYQVLASLPGSAGITLQFDNAGVGTHLGGVYIGQVSILLNRSRLTGNPGLTRDVIRHEITHVYQGRLIASSGISQADLAARLTAVFGGKGLEMSADCVAQHFGATQLFYTHNCAGGAKQAWVNALIGGYLP